MMKREGGEYKTGQFIGNLERLSFFLITIHFSSTNSFPQLDTSSLLLLLKHNNYYYKPINNNPCHSFVKWLSGFQSVPVQTPLAAVPFLLCPSIR